MGQKKKMQSLFPVFCTWCGIAGEEGQADEGHVTFVFLLGKQGHMKAVRLFWCFPREQSQYHWLDVIERWIVDQDKESLSKAKHFG